MAAATRRFVLSRIPRLAGTERLILSVLHEGEQFALRLADRSGGVLKRGTVYITLQRMESKGYVESHLEPPIEGVMGRPRRWYRPSAYGRQVLAAWQLAERALDDAVEAEYDEHAAESIHA
jgi:DNA-binding PadR family transcriptional regulator